MSKVTLTFDTYEDREELADALNGTKNAAKLEDIWEECFRKNNKHGYGNPILDSDEAYEVIEALKEIYLEIVND